MAQKLQAINKLFQVELIIFNQREYEFFSMPDDKAVLEKYIFRIDNSKIDLHPYIFQFEQEIRRGLLELNQKKTFELVESCV